MNNFEDEDFLRKQKKEFDQFTPQNALSEMRAFENYRSKGRIKSMPLSSAFSDHNIWFDDCICQEDGFETTWGDKKNLYWCEGRLKANQLKDNKPFEFATINCSWTTELVFRWIAEHQQGIKGTDKYIKHYLKFSKREALANILNKIMKRMYNGTHKWAQLNTKH